jgi:hypothetical protein
MRARLALLILCGAFLSAPIQAEYQLSGYLSAQYEKGGSESAFSGGTFGKARAGLLFAGTAENIFDYALELRFKTEDRLEIEEAWVGLSPSPAFHLKLGIYLVPFGKYNTFNRPHQTLFIQPPLTQAEIYPESWRDVGVAAEGSVSFLRYAAYVGNGLREDVDLGAGQQFKDNNTNKSFGGRVGILLSKSFELGASYCRGKYDDADKRNLEHRGVDLSWITDAFRLLYEYTEARIENPDAFARGRAAGHFALLALSWGALLPFGSYQTFEYEDEFHGPGFGPAGLPGSGILSEGSRWAIGLTYVVSSGLLLKVEYDFNREEGPALKNDRFLAQVAVQF